MTDYTIAIVTNPKFRPLRIAYYMAWSVGIIGLGVLVNSQAMEWFGFVLACIGWAAIAEKDTGLTIDQARARIDEIEANEIGAGVTHDPNKAC